ncbi:MAG: tetratricopeptide repeat protein [Deltaproteobacteria bacterium]
MSASKRQRVSFAAGLLFVSTTAAMHARAAAPGAGRESGAARTKDVGVRLTQAIEEFRAGRFAAAREQLDAVLAADPQLPERATIAFNAAVASYALEDYADALRRFESLSRQAPELAALARVNAGFAALRTGDLKLAETYAEPVGSQTSDLEQRRQKLLLELSQARQARADQALVERLDAGFAAVSQRDWGSARAAFTEALGLARPEDANELADAHYGLGLIAAELGESRRAQEQFEQSLAARPGDPRTLLALARSSEDASDPARAETAYETALALPLEKDQVADAQRSLFQLYPLPETGSSVLVSMGVGADGNAIQSGSGDVLANSAGESRSSAYVSGLLDLALVLRASRRSAFGLNYSGDLLALLHPSVDDLSLQAHEWVARAHWAPAPSARLRLDAGATYALTGLSPMRSFEWDGVLTLSADLDTGLRSRARLQLGERLVRASELSYLDGHRVQLLATESWFLGSWEPSLLASLRYIVAGTQQVELAADTYAACSPDCDRVPYQNPMSYWSPGAGAGLGWQATSALRFSSLARLDYRGYLDASGIPGIRASRKTREDWRFRGQLRTELSLDQESRFRLTLDQTLLVSRSNVAFDASDPDHRYDYGDRNFVQPTIELGITASLP